LVFQLLRSLPFLIAVPYFSLPILFLGITSLLFANNPFHDLDAEGILGRRMNLQVSANSLLDALIEESQEAIVCFHLNGTVAIWNAAAEQLFGFSATEVLGKHFSLILPIYEIPIMEDLLRNPDPVVGSTPEMAERLHKQGILLSLRIQRSVVRSESGAPVALLERASASGREIAGNTAETHLRLMMEHMPGAFWTVDQRLQITSHGGSGFRGVNLFRGHAKGQSVQDYLGRSLPHETPAKQHFDALQGISSRFEYRKRKHVFDISLEPMRNTDGEIIGCIGVALDITERKKTEEEIRYQATHDGLTGLSNYREFVDRLEDEVRRTDRSGRSFGLLLLDLDGLKLINDRLGHLAGNRALKRLTRVMKENSRVTDLAARYGGDEFSILLIDADDKMTETVAQRVREGLRQTGDSQALTVSIGAAVYPHDGKTALELLELADQRLYREKSATRKFSQSSKPIKP
jgi:diguanylate cyclase (GGDEF)-like protein/PAS domain S-box-containing protein